MNPTPENDEQSAFEAWLSSTEPSGDAESVRRQWEQSHEYRALFESEKNETPLTDAAWNKYREHYDLHAFEKMVKFARELERDRKRLRDALEKITNIKWGWDGDCGANNIAEDAISDSEALDAKLSKETK